MEAPNAGITHVVYDPPVSSLPYLDVVFLPTGSLQVRALESAVEADGFIARTARAARSGEAPRNRVKLRPYHEPMTPE